MAEMIAYVALYGVVMSLLASLVFVIISSARKINSQSILNRGASILYTELLSEIIRINPDYVGDVETTADGNTISIQFEKKYKYNDEGERIEIKSDDAEYANKPVKIKYSYTKGNDNIDVIYTSLSGVNTADTINLDYGMTITSVDSDSIENVFKVDKQNTSNKYVTINGNLNFDKKKMEFNYIIPIFTTIESD
ncbi:MAG: hypothetical protein K6E87_04000 [bacterium]|nr:hypothetical protein [bacterium]